MDIKKDPEYITQQELLEATEIGSWEWDIETGIVRWSENLEKIHGMKPGTFGGTFEEFLACIHPADRPRVRKEINRAIDEHDSYHVEHRWVCKEGDIIWLEGKGRVVRNTTGKAVRMNGICMDITKRKRTEQLYKEQLADMERLHSLSTRLLMQDDVEAALHEVMSASAELLDADKASVQIFNRDDNVLELISYKDFSEDFAQQFQLVKPEDFTTCAAAINQRERVLVEDLSADPEFAKFYQAAAPYGIKAAMSTPLFGGDDKLFGVFTMYWKSVHSPTEDELQLFELYTQQALRMIERQWAEETLEERVEERTKSLLSYQKQLRSLASKLSQAEEQERRRLATELHDNLGQMLAVGKMKMDLLPKKDLPTDTAAGIEEIQQVMDDALVYTRELMSDLKPPPSLDKEDIRDSIEWVAQKMEKHDLKVIVDDDEQPKKVANDIRTTLLQSVRELLFNVIKHAKVDKARVKMRCIDRQVKVTVADEGDGFDPNAEQSESTRDGGFGLFNIKERVDLIGGNVHIDSAPGDGTKVTLLAPLKNQDQSQVGAKYEEENEENKTLQTDQKIKVLLADDHKMMREGLRKIVEEEDDLVVVAEAADGQEAIKLAEDTSPDIIVMDVNMPVMDGITATKELTTSRTGQQRIIGLSLHDHDKVIKSMRDAGASAYLSKNEAFETLCATIRSEANSAGQFNGP